MNRRWRPSLGFVLGGALSGTLALSFAGLLAFRYLGPEIGFRNAAMLLAALIALATAFLGWLLVRLLLRPITALERYAAEVRTAPRVTVAPPEHFGTRELRKTALSVIEMADTLRDRETTIRSYTDHVTHELKSPVSAIRAAVELLEDGGTLGPDDRRLLQEIAGAGTQIEMQLEALRRAARAREARYVGAVTLDGLIDDLAAQHEDLSLHVVGGDLPVPLAPEGLRIVLGHLLTNSSEHGAKRVSLTASSDGAQLCLAVTDDGQGISEGNRARVFDPFFTTKREHGGTGMGLAIVLNILTAHGGQIACLPACKGTTFRLSFPRFG